MSPDPHQNCIMAGKFNAIHSTFADKISALFIPRHSIIVLFQLQNLMTIHLIIFIYKIVFEFGFRGEAEGEGVCMVAECI